MVAAASSFAFALNAQDSGIETRAIGVLIEFLLVGAKLDRDWEAREVNIEWTVVYVECLL